MATTAKPQLLRRTADTDLRDTRDQLEGWFRKLEEWGEKVRDDIMALEDAVIELDKGKVLDRPFRRKSGRPVRRYEQKNLGGDPGDPPQDPFD